MRRSAGRGVGRDRGVAVCQVQHTTLGEPIWGRLSGDFFPFFFINCPIGSLLSFAFEHEIVAYFMCKEVKRQRKVATYFTTN